MCMIVAAAAVVIVISVDFYLYRRLQKRIDRDYTIELTPRGWDKTAKD